MFDSLCLSLIPCDNFCAEIENFNAAVELNNNLYCQIFRKVSSTSQLL